MSNAALLDHIVLVWLFCFVECELHIRGLFTKRLASGVFRRGKPGLGRDGVREAYDGDGALFFVLGAPTLSPIATNSPPWASTVGPAAVA